jgi:hypothetical protein
VSCLHLPPVMNCVPAARERDERKRPRRMALVRVLEYIVGGKVSELDQQ